MPSKVVMKKVRSNGSLGFISLRRGFCSQWPTGQQALDYARRKGDDPVTDVDLLNHTLQSKRRLKDVSTNQTLGRR